MLPDERAHPNPGDWRRELAAGPRDARELLEALELDPATVGLSAAAARAFRLLVPWGFVARMHRGDPGDPLLRQVLPTAGELATVPGFGPDPLRELEAHAGAGVIRKYAGRALLVVTGACAVHCRYCFRRHFPYAGAHASGRALTRALATIAADPSVEEVILSGGDPLMLDDDHLAGLLAALRALPRVRRVRIHTRLPVVLPERVTAALRRLLAAGPGSTVVVIHANHPAEMAPQVTAACRALADDGVTVLNQSVLLAGVNDDADVLATLSERLFDARVLPYYLHMLDPVAGAAHFAVPDERARALAAALRARLPGYLVPRLVREVPGAASKLPV